MASKAGEHLNIYFSEYYQRYMAFFIGDNTEERDSMLKDYSQFNKYKKNLKLYSEIEAFENWQESEDFDKK